MGEDLEKFVDPETGLTFGENGHDHGREGERA